MCVFLKNRILPILYPKHVPNNDKNPKVKCCVNKSWNNPIKKPANVALLLLELRAINTIMIKPKSGDISIPS